MPRDLSALETTPYQLVVIGAGVHGACIARDAALRGLSVLLVDKGDICGATSHNSLKTIHGGIRYLQHLNFKRTLESIREQHYWLKTAPQRVKPLTFLMPTYGYGGRGPLFMGIGVLLYELLAWRRNKGIDNAVKVLRGRLFGKHKTLQMAPHIERNQLTGGATWDDAQVSHADQVVLEICLHAAENGATIANYMTAEDLVIKRNIVRGVQLTDQISGRQYTIKADIVVNAAGPWAAKYLNGTSPLFKNIELPLTKSMNLVVNRKPPAYAIGVKSKRQSDAVISSGQRLYFVVPWLDVTMLGTSHFPYDGKIDQLQSSQAEIEQFLKEVNQAYPGFNLQPEDVLYAYQGLTPGAETHKQQRGATRLDHSKVIDHSVDDIQGLVSVISVKWTTARGVAEKTVNLICQKLDIKARCMTRTLPIPAILSAHTEIATADDDTLIKHVRFHIDNTFALTLADILLRRTNDFVTGKLSPAQIRLIAHTMAQHFDWNSTQKQLQLDMILAKYLPEATRQQLTYHALWN